MRSMLLDSHLHFIPKVLPVLFHEHRQPGASFAVWRVVHSVLRTSGHAHLQAEQGSRLSCHGFTNSSFHDALAQHGSPGTSLTWEVTF